MNKKTYLILATTLTATFVASTAAFFSVSGIAKLFAGATISVIIMASSLELGKIIGVSFLYQYWKQIPKLLKTYLVTASCILMLITSLGIYGFLSGAYQATSDQLTAVDAQIATIQLKKQRFETELTLSLQEKDRLTVTAQDLNKGLSNNILQYKDKVSGQLITTTSSANRTALKQQLSFIKDERIKLETKINQLSDSVSKLDIEILQLKTNNKLASEVGPLRFVSKLTGFSMDHVVSIFALMIVFVFDPLAIALIIAANFLIKQDNTPPPEAYNQSILPNIDTNLPMIESPTYGSDEEILNKYLDNDANGIPSWMNKNYNWDNTMAWVNNPFARAYKQQIIDKNI